MLKNNKTPDIRKPKARYFDVFISQSMTTFYTKQLSHKAPFTTFTLDTFYNEQLLHQPPFTPGTLYTRNPLHAYNFYRHLLDQNHLHQTIFTPNNFHNSAILSSL